MDAGEDFRGSAAPRATSSPRRSAPSTTRTSSASCAATALLPRGEDEELECGAFRVLRRLLQRRALTVRQLLEAAETDER